MKNTDIEISGKNLILNNVSDFRLSHTFECGQCFRWDSRDTDEFDEEYVGTALGRVLKIAQKDDKIILFDTSLREFQNIWEKYLDFSRNYGKIKDVLSGDDVMRRAIGFGYGIHILNQDVWECIVSFIISASNNIPRIKRIINTLCKEFGN
ncbi:MAG: 8-oxoguanine DNA glycosylase, N-terminal domain-containing protein, partial [Oscillospiraceae bacterium]|nr:8-oxoguanine DNA glycosylase, N-terminal domain-containing protein [Oscillospiraceae bacterium]